MNRHDTQFALALSVYTNAFSYHKKQFILSDVRRQIDVSNRAIVCRHSLCPIDVLYPTWGMLKCSTRMSAGSSLSVRLNGSDRSADFD